VSDFDANNPDIGAKNLFIRKERVVSAKDTLTGAKA